MRGSAVAQNYAEVLFELAQRSGQLDEYGRLLDAAWGAIAASREVQAVLASPKVSKGRKAAILGSALGQAGAPIEFIRFLEAVVKRGRQMALGAIADSYTELVDASLNRVRASVTLARAPDPALRAAIEEALGRVLGKQVVAAYAVDPVLLGGAVIRVGDRVFDGSLRRRFVRLRRRLLAP